MRAVLFDFFGTLVTYEPNRLNLEYAQTELLLHRWGYENAGERFAEVWHAVSHRLELTTSRSMAEFTMDDVLTEYDAAEQLELDAQRRVELLDSFMSEWRAGVRPANGVHDVLADLSRDCQLGIVSNTHDPHLVPSLIDAFGLDAAFGGVFDPVVLSVDHGYRKPHPSIYEVALDAMNMAADRVLFIGDSFEPDYVGPVAAGMHARLIDPLRRHPVPDAHRIDSLRGVREAVDQTFNA